MSSTGELEDPEKQEPGSRRKMHPKQLEARRIYKNVEPEDKASG